MVKLPRLGRKLMKNRWKSKGVLRKRRRKKQKDRAPIGKKHYRWSGVYACRKPKYCIFCELYNDEPVEAGTV